MQHFWDSRETGSPLFEVVLFVEMIKQLFSLDVELRAVFAKRSFYKQSLTTVC